jgi:hypothetical protein
MRTKILNIKEIVLDTNIYPRVMIDRLTSIRYTYALKSGSVFPLITVTKLDKKYYAIDGWHRIQAYKNNHIMHIKAELVKCKDMQEAYIEAVKRNAVHGKQFSVQEQAIIINKLQEIGLEKAIISRIIPIPQDKIEKFVADRMTVNSVGQPVFLKAPLKNMSSAPVSMEFNQEQHILTASSDLQLLDQVNFMLKNNAFDMNNPKVRKRIEEIYDFLYSLLSK